MTDLVLLRTGCYHDSARLMQVGRELSSLPGISEAVAMMGTPTNRELLRAAGFSGRALDEATPLDMVVALRGASADAFAATQEALDALLSGKAAAAGTASAGETLPGSVAEAIEARPGTNLVSVAVPGPYAAFVAHRALDAGRSVFLFSDNVALGDEVALKRRAATLGLLVMGPDCGTAILAGVGLGFANRVERGPVGIVGASGTGIQELCSLLDRRGVGVSHAIGTGSRDLSAEVGGLMTEAGLALLAKDPATRALLLVAKHPDPGVAERLHGLLAKLGKPVAVRYLGEGRRGDVDGVLYAGSLDEAAESAARSVGAAPPRGDAAPAAGDVAAGGPGASRLVGLFGGGSLAAEARCVLEARGIATRVPEEKLTANAPLPSGNLVVDTGDDAYTVGRPHPMVDQTVRCELIRAAGSDPSVGVLLLDLVLGDGAHPDPAHEIVEAVAAAVAARSGLPLSVVASVCGTRRDPQGTARQEETLRRAGVVARPSAALAAAEAADLVLVARQEVVR
ncbi:MAG: acyl-CoA synthetase FdrA [Thermoanaerobaculia bacterium]|nr:acyl-CoA synthetase FdrA [Thermoanaerobaculia bacterium]